MEKISIANGSQYHQQLQIFKDSKLFQRLNEKFRIKPYYEQNKSLRIAARISSYLFNLFSVLIGFFFIYNLLKSFLGVIIGVILSIAMLIVLESFKRLILPPIAKHYFQFKKIGKVRVLIGICLISLSAFFSYQGGEVAVHEFSIEQHGSSTNVDSTRNYYAKIIGSKLEQQNKLFKTKYKGTTTRTAQKAINAIQTEINSLRSQESEVLSLAMSADGKTLTKTNNQKYTYGIYFSLLALIFDLALILCLIYVEFYDYTSLAEFGTLPNKDTPTVPTIEDQNGSQGVGGKELINKEIKNDSKTIAATAKKNCLNCSDEFEGGNKRKKFCSTSCRVKHWNKKNEKQLSVPIT